MLKFFLYVSHWSHILPPHVQRGEGERDGDCVELALREGEALDGARGEDEALAEGDELAEKGEGEALAEKGEGEALAEKGAGEALAEKGAGEELAERGEGEVFGEGGALAEVVEE